MFGSGERTGGNRRHADTAKNRFTNRTVRIERSVRSPLSVAFFRRHVLGYAMQFCEECGSMMIAEGDRMVCTNEDCGAATAQDADLAAEFVSTEKQSDDELIETEEGAAFEGKPTANVRCSECGNDTAWYTIKQTASADEPPTRFFKCTECGRRWRDYG